MVFKPPVVRGALGPAAANSSAVGVHPWLRPASAMHSREWPKPSVDMQRSPLQRTWAWSLSRSRKPSSGQIFATAFSLAIRRPISALKFSGLAQADSPVTVKPLRSRRTQKVSRPSEPGASKVNGRSTPSGDAAL